MNPTSSPPSHACKQKSKKDAPKAICEYSKCQKSYKKNRKWQHFCSPECRKKAWQESKTDPKLRKAIRLLEQKVASLERAINISLNPKTPKNSIPKKEANKKGSDILIGGCISNGGNDSVSSVKKLKGGKRENDCQS